MAWTAEKVRALRESNPSETAKKDEESGKWTAERVRALRTSSPGRGAKGVAAAEGNDLYSTALEDYRTRNNLGFADAMDSRSDELNRQKVTASPAENTLGTWYGQQAQKLKNSYAEYSQPDDFDQANQWFDQPRNQELVNKLLEKKSNYTSYAETGTSRNGASAGDGSIDPFRTTGIKGKVGNTYSTEDLKKLGYTDTEIRQAREYLDTMEEIPEWKQLARRTANTVGGVADTVAAAPLMGAEYLVQAGKNIRQSSENRKALEAELARNPREKNLYDQLMETDMDYQPKYSTGDLLQQGFTRQEIEDMRSRIAGTEAKGGIDTEKSVGYQLYNRGQQLTGAAQSGLTDVQRTVQGVATSAAENLAVAAINPAAVLPVLSAQGAADAMGKSAAKGESAGKALVGGVAKFGAGWAINSVGAADLARTMGADYARNSVAGAVADKIRALAGDSAFAAAHPAVANAISGGIDNAMQAFVETYADKAIDAVLGDSEAAQTMFTTDTLVQALEAGLTGGASGALGGAVGTGLSRMNAGDSSLRGNVERYAAQDEYEQALKEHQRREELAREPGDGIAEQTVVNDDPAVHTAAQNASIEEYKNSVDPKMAEYVDKVRAGEKLEPYVVTRTSDRMRSAMMELTGLDKVGDYTLLDNNGVQHITNRHAGGDGSADATMKNSADVARAAYVLNNFDNAYLGTRKAEGYFDSRSKRAPIVIFEKKIDGSHIIVEAVTDTKRGKNYIISEYLSSVGVDPKEIAKTLRPPMDAAESDPRHTSETLNEEISAISASMPQSPMDAVADPRDTSKTLAEDYDATASIAPGEGSVNGNRVKNGVETVESTAETAADGNTPHPSAAQTASHQGEAFSSYADVENRVDAAQLNTADWNRGEQRAAARQLVNRAQMTTKAAQAVVDAMPQGVGAAVYAQAANSLYRMGVTQDVKSFEQAVNLTGGMNSLGGAVRQVLALGKTGENALAHCLHLRPGRGGSLQRPENQRNWQRTGSSQPGRWHLFQGPEREQRHQCHGRFY